MNRRVLVTYSSRTGSTAEVAGEIARVLKARGLEAAGRRRCPLRNSFMGTQTSAFAERLNKLLQGPIR